MAKGAATSAGMTQPVNTADWKRGKKDEFWKHPGPKCNRKLAIITYIC